MEKPTKPINLRTETFADMMRRADEQLYLAKAHGRNKVMQSEGVG